MNTDVLAMANIPIQLYGDIYDPKIALRCGTLVAELELPFYAGGKSNERTPNFSQKKQ